MFSRGEFIAVVRVNLTPLECIQDPRKKNWTRREKNCGGKEPAV